MAGRLYGHDAIELSILGLLAWRGRDLGSLVEDAKGVVHPFLTPTTDAIEARLLVSAARAEIRLDMPWVEMGERGPERLRQLLLASLRQAAPEALPLWESLKLGLVPRLPAGDRRAVVDDMLAARRCCLDAESSALEACDPACPLSRSCLAHRLVLAETAYVGLRGRVDAVLAAC
jgi:hypothetical protein